ncbi:MAG: hypothetical protein AOY29_04990 [Alcanivorax borkumensis]|uniref:DUF1826 domain-containing protein n=1 Tax=Alcanivorax borkumensis (strain ATCC 700651 / DSM 11573 / NCIMB 13689 / SK2) TaxID=393595 RepID=Q0VNX2_ALCBS|nr:DUF1826 domain-containing protein [Alcanivorax borkumensis]OJH06945.1 MAG: hypothetical protein AOY29_04990 [Alcanivorax borkumensis]CAL17126.1 conserved hypothetical protein [Alcanivorax borkumensis SK2]
MTMAVAQAEITTSQWHCSPDAAVLADIVQDDMEVAVWDRPSPVGQDVVALACQQRLALKHWLELSQLEGAIERMLPDERYGALRDDLVLLADMTACLFGVSGLGLRVTALQAPMCPRFHVDRIPVRLLCTYGGQGSQWLPFDCVDDQLLSPGSNQPLLFQQENVKQLEAGQVALLKGESWRDNPGAGVVHRSPPMSPGQQRLLITLDI